jgi:hypothetical protein
MNQYAMIRRVGFLEFLPSVASAVLTFMPVSHASVELRGQNEIKETRPMLWRPVG